MIPQSDYYVYLGGHLYGQGRWSGPHSTRAEAEQSARDCVRVTGAVGYVDCEPRPTAPQPKPAASIESPPTTATGAASYYHGADERRYSGD